MWNHVELILHHLGEALHPLITIKGPKGFFFPKIRLNSLEHSELKMDFFILKWHQVKFVLVGTYSSLELLVKTY